MQGPGADPGIIPRVVEALFAKTAATTQIETAELAVSYMEIYKDDVYDLLVAREDAPKLPVRENDAGAVLVAGLTETPIASAVEFKQVYDTATARRSVGATLLNRASSRSHAVLTLTIRRVTVATNGGGGRTREVLGKLNLVDLAGSENNKLTGNDPSRMAESSAINMSLLVLGQVVHALNTGASCVPYRNAKLTHILQDALSGSSVGLLICNLAPSTKFRLDTLNTLNFAARMKNIKNKPMVDKRDLRPPRPPAPVPPKLDLAAQPPAPKPLISFALPPPNRAGARPSLVPRPVDADGHGVPDVQPTEAEAAHVSDDQMEVDKVETSLTGRTAFGFGQELTNTGSKRALALAVDARMETTTKRPKRSGSPKKLRVINIESDKKDEFVPDSAFRDDGAMNGDTDDDTPVQRSQTQSNISLASPSKQPTRVMELDPGQCPECQQKGAKLTAQHLCDANHAASFTETLYKKRSKHVVKLFRELADLHFVCACGERFRSIADGRTHFEILRKDRDNTHSLGFATGPSQGTHFVKNIWKKKASKSLNEDSRD
ncbi:P-loop containing nucleoside triphosphate hydrolase protein [Mycena galericulata]|nr:P-loop containing nucleoside triphosphate hydrolase protein [Mycena galericulata]